MIPMFVVAVFLMAGAEVGPADLDDGWVLWVENTGIRTVVDAQKKTRQGRDPVEWTIEDGFDTRAECRAAIAQKFSGLPKPSVDHLISDKPLPRGMFIVNNQTLALNSEFPNGEKLYSQYRHICLPGTIDPREQRQR